MLSKSNLAEDDKHYRKSLFIHWFTDLLFQAKTNESTLIQKNSLVADYAPSLAFPFGYESLGMKYRALDHNTATADELDFCIFCIYHRAVFCYVNAHIYSKSQTASLITFRSKFDSTKATVLYFIFASHLRTFPGFISDAPSVSLKRRKQSKAIHVASRHHVVIMIKTSSMWYERNLLVLCDNNGSHGIAMNMKRWINQSFPHAHAAEA